MEAVLGGELYQQMKRVEKFPPKQATFYSAQICAVFEHLHAKNIIFRDLKPENVLIASDGYLKVVDFGLAKAVPNGKTYTLCGTPACELKIFFLILQTFAYLCIPLVGHTLITIFFFFFFFFFLNNKYRLITLLNTHD